MFAVNFKLTVVGEVAFITFGFNALELATSLFKRSLQSYDL
jgi:hypothetical protein